MSVAARLLLILLFVALAPLGVSVVTALRSHEHALDASVAELHRKTAEYGARSTTAALDTARRTIGGLTRTIPWNDLSVDERRGALLLVYEQLDDVVAVTLLDGHGVALDATVYTEDGATTSRHPRSSPMARAALGRALPVTFERASGSAIGDPVMMPHESVPVVPIAFAVTGPGGASWTLAVDFSLRGACAELAAASPVGVGTRLEDGRGAVLCGATASIDDDVLTARVALPSRWSVVVEQPAAEALASTRRIRLQSMFWIALGVVAAILAGLVLTQTIRRPLRALTIAAERLTAGELGHRVAVTGRDEFGALGTAFNRMGGEIERQDREIRSWNEDLQRRVDARTAELRDAQDQLLESRKLGAMAALGAGVAHEINNPLAGVLGLTQVLIARGDELDARAQRSLHTIEREALRVRDIVERMASLAQDSIAGAVPLDVATVVEAALAPFADRLVAASVIVERVFVSDLPRVSGNTGQLQHAIGHLIDNSIKAMTPGGGRLLLAVRVIESELISIAVEDTGRGIAPELLDKIFEPFFTTKDDWRGQGLGLALAYRVFEAHQGRIRASSRPGAGTTMTITLPVARRGAHLA